MTVLCGAEKDRFLRPGTLVRLSIQVNHSAMLEPDYGVVVHCWKERDEGAFDCLVAFLGEPFPANGPVEDPYVCKYSASSLAEIPDESVPWLHTL